MRNIQEKKGKFKIWTCWNWWYVSKYRNNRVQQNWVVLLPLLPTIGAIWRSLLSLSAFPFQSYSTWEKPRFPLQRWERPGLRNPRALQLPCDSGTLIIVAILSTQLPSVSGLNKSKPLWIIFIIMSIYHNVLY